MISLVFFLALLGSLFALSFLTKRRFGVLGLALAAGAVLSTNWAATLTPFIEQQGVTIAVPPLSTVVAAGLVLAPPLLLLFSGPSYNKTSARVLGSAAFSVLAFAFLLDPLGDAVQVSEQGMMLYKVFLDYQSLIIVTGLIIAVADIFVTRKGSHGKGRKAEH